MTREQSAVIQAGVRRVLWITLLLNLAVSAGKVLVGSLTGSLAMVADGYHSLVDGSNNVIGLIVAAFAYAPPDPGHPYGHRKFETAATLVIGGALLLLAYRVVENAVAHIARQQLPSIGFSNWAVMIATLGVNFFVSWYEAREGRRLGSSYLVADAAHTRSDLYVSLGVIISFAGAHAGWSWADAVVAVSIAAVIAVQAVKILTPAFHVLTDRAVLPAEGIVAVVRQVPGVLDCREVRTRGGGDAVYVDLTVYADGDMTLRAAHAVADRIEQVLKKAHPVIVDVMVHVEPAERP
ncbi:MAG TPA: cation diffusion facilitator family transporter [Vicinamibacteria bacterium]|nr:cation diffusion facilitator family transporter [Vicinamibacteria bacterium]